MSSQNMTIFFFFFFFFFFLGGGGGGGISVHFRYRLKYLLGVAKKSKFVWVCPIFFLYYGRVINSSCWVQAYVARKH